PIITSRQLHRLRSAAIFAKLPSLDSIVSSTSRKNAFKHEARPCCPSGLDLRGCCRSWPAQVGIFSRLCSASEDLCFALLHGRAQDHLLDGQVQRRCHRNQDCPGRHHQDGSQQRDRGRHDPLHDRNRRDQAVHHHQALCRDLDQEQSHHQDLHRGRQHEQGHHGRQERDQPQRRPQDDPDGRDQALHHRSDDRDGQHLPPYFVRALHHLLRQDGEQVRDQDQGRLVNSVPVSQFYSFGKSPAVGVWRPSLIESGI
ncbi:hypothetical protein IWZ03DRAFT_424541, partial [Phyllosticta citriasiana]